MKLWTICLFPHVLLKHLPKTKVPAPTMVVGLDHFHTSWKVGPNCVRWSWGTVKRPNKSRCVWWNDNCIHAMVKRCQTCRVVLLSVFFSGAGDPSVQRSTHTGPWTLLSAWWSSRVAMNQQSTSRVQTYGTAQNSPIMSAIFNEAGESRLVCIWCTSKIQDDFGLFRHFLGLKLNPRPFTWVRNVWWPYRWVVLM